MGAMALGQVPVYPSLLLSPQEEQDLKENPATRPSPYLCQGICYFSASAWVVWVNGKRYDADHPPVDFKLQVVSPTQIMITAHQDPEPVYVSLNYP